MRLRHSLPAPPSPAALRRQTRHIPVVPLPSPLTPDCIAFRQQHNISHLFIALIKRIKQVSDTFSIRGEKKVVEVGLAGAIIRSVHQLGTGKEQGFTILLPTSTECTIFRALTTWCAAQTYASSSVSDPDFTFSIAFRSAFSELD